MPRHLSLTLLATCLLAACASAPAPKSEAHAKPASTGLAATTPTDQALTNEVIATEQAFAKTVADHNMKGFVSYLSAEAVFFSGNNVAHGPAEIAQQWERYVDAKPATFSWAPDHVEVLASGNLALSSGPVYSDGHIIGRFNSVWRLEAPNTWKVVFDKGEAVCSVFNP